ncbi:MAG: sigma 54-interacting transcriptional regulator [Candidatus Eisenbacteria bacterium]
MAVEVGFPREEALGYEFLGDLDRAAGDGKEAGTLYRKGMEIGLRIAPEGDVVCEIGRRLAEWHLERGEFAESRRELEASLGLAEKIGDRREEGILHRVKARLLFASGGRIQSAEASLKKSLRILGDVGARFELALSFAERARQRAAAPRRTREERRRSLRDFDRAAAIFRDLDLGRRRGFLLVEGVRALQGTITPHECLRLLRDAEDGLRPFHPVVAFREIERLRADLEMETARIALEKEGPVLLGEEECGIEPSVRALGRRLGAKIAFLHLPGAPEGNRLVGAGAESAAPVFQRLRDTDDRRLIVSAGRTTGGPEECHGPYLAFRPDDAEGSLLYVERRIGADPFSEKEAGEFTARGKALLRRVPSVRPEASSRTHPRIIAGSRVMQDLVDRIASVRNSPATVLIEGETGTGKGLLARLLHEMGDRGRAGRFVHVHCAEFPETLLESELFGHARGSFTGAVADKEGLFERARGGTLFLDEVGDFSSAVQIRLLRVIEEGRMKRVGEAEDREIDVRVVAATHRDLEAEVDRGRFRGDLFYRLHVIRVQVPPLRDRPGDIPLLAEHFVKMCAAEERKTVDGITPEAVRLLARHPWPGNVRELQNEIRRAIALLPAGRAIGPADLSRVVRSGAIKRRPPQHRLLRAVAEFEEDRIKEAVRESGGSPGTAAEILGISRQLLRYKLKKFGIKMPQLPPE